MDNLIVKPVDVLGSSIMAAQDEKGRIFAGVNYFCNALGMTKGQRDKQVQKVQKDEVLKQGCFRLEAGVFDPSNESITLRIDFIPLWLAKIVITEKTRKENPELADKLLEYQLKAKDILAAAFLPQQESTPQTLQSQIRTIAQGTDELYQRVEGVEGRIQDLENTMNLDHGQQRQLEKAVNKTVINILGGKESNAYKEISRKVFCECNGNLKDYFHVNARGDVPRKRYEEALAYAQKWRPCINTQMLIEQYNAQQSLTFEGGAQP